MFATVTERWWHSIIILARIRTDTPGRSKIRR